MHDSPRGFRLTLMARDGQVFEATMTSDQALSDALKDACFDLLHIATSDPERHELTVTVRVTQEIA